MTECYGILVDFSSGLRIITDQVMFLNTTSMHNHNIAVRKLGAEYDWFLLRLVCGFLASSESTNVTLRFRPEGHGGPSSKRKSGNGWSKCGLAVIVILLE